MPNKNNKMIARQNKSRNKKNNKQNSKAQTTEASLGRHLLRALGGLGGGAAGLFTNGPAGILSGANAGYALGNKAATVLGMGSYTVKSNSLYDATIRTGQVPNMHTSGQSVIVRHKEYRGCCIFSYCWSF